MVVQRTKLLIFLPYIAIHPYSTYKIKTKLFQIQLYNHWVELSSIKFKVKYITWMVI